MSRNSEISHDTPAANPTLIMAKPGIRAYDRSDKGFVRDISWRTADAGAPALWFRDKELLADILTGYYLEFEQDSCFVLAENGVVGGYITGCSDTVVFNKTMRYRVLPPALLAAFARGTFFKPWFFRLVRANLTLRPSRCPVDYNLFPAHLHINLLPQTRGRKAGQELLDVLIDGFKRKDVPGIHVSVRDDNAGGIAFFKRNGFNTAGRYEFFRPSPGIRLYSLIMTKAL